MKAAHSNLVHRRAVRLVKQQQIVLYSSMNTNSITYYQTFVKYFFKELQSPF